MASTHSDHPAVAFPERGLPERIGPPASLSPDQQQAARELIEGPRGGVYGPFRPLLHSPSLLRAVGKIGETLRYQGTLESVLREWTICVVARELSNVFEWDMHRLLAAAVGVPVATLDALEAHRPLPDGTSGTLVLAQQVAREIIRQHRLDDVTWASARAEWGEATLIELLSLIGYFAMVCWLMNVARTPGPQASC